MSDISTIIIAFVVAGALLGVEYFLGKQKNCLLGGIIPLISVIFAICVFRFTKLTLSFRNLFPFLILTNMFLTEWEYGRKRYKKEKEAELDKMKAQDIN